MLVARPWTTYVVGMAVLSLPDRLVSPGVSRFLDPAIAWGGLIGLVAAALVSVVSARRNARASEQPVPVVRLLLAGFFAPALATLAVTGITRNVDGSMWMIFSPVLGTICVVLALVVSAVVAAVRKRPDTE